MREQVAKEPRIKDHSVDSGSKLQTLLNDMLVSNSHTIIPLKMMTTKSLVGKATLNLMGKASLLEEVIANLLMSRSLIVMEWMLLQ